MTQPSTRISRFIRAQAYRNAAATTPLDVEGSRCGSGGRVASGERRTKVSRSTSGAGSKPAAATPVVGVGRDRRVSGWKRLAARLAGVASKRLRHAFAICLAIASTSVPAGQPDRSEATSRLKQHRQVAARTAAVVEEARVTHIAQRYRRPPEQVRHLVRVSERAAAKHGLPPELLLAIVETESGFNTAARSRYGARGLMQVVPRFHPEIVKQVGGVHRLDEPEANIEAGARILATYVESSGSLNKALVRYSGGARSYASKVASRQRELERIATTAARQVDAMRVSALAEPVNQG